MYLFCVYETMKLTSRHPILTVGFFAVMALIPADTAAYPAILDSPNWQVRGAPGSHFGTSASSAGDVNGDGYADIIIGAPDFGTPGLDSAGEALLWFGSPLGPGATPDWAFRGTEPGMTVGYRVAAAGDVNGDGYADILVTAPQQNVNAGERGWVYLFYGSSTGPSMLPDWTFTGAAEGAGYDTQVAGAADLNRDGYDDIVIGAGFDEVHRVNEGRVYVFLGSAFGLSEMPVWVASGGQTQATFGGSVAIVPDVDGDGYDDLLVGAQNRDGRREDTGVARLYRGASSGPRRTHSWRVRGEWGDRIGSRVAAAGDVNGDGYGDILVGSLHGGAIRGGKVALYEGSSKGVSRKASWSYESRLPFSYFGGTMASGDLNGDGYQDVMVGEYLRHDEKEGAAGQVYVFFGSAAGLPSEPELLLRAPQDNGAVFGAGLGVVGDVNGDGCDDVLVGDPSLYDIDSGSVAGAAYLYLGMCSSDALGVISSPER